MATAAAVVPVCSSSSFAASSRHGVVRSSRREQQHSTAALLPLRRAALGTARVSIASRSRRATVCMSQASPTQSVKWFTIWESLRDKKLRSVGIPESREMLENHGYKILDVRPASDFQEGHAEGAIGVELFRYINSWNLRKVLFTLQGVAGTEANPNFTQEVLEKVGSKDTPILVMCSTGGTLRPSYDWPYGKHSRSLTAAYRLLEDGFTNVVHFGAGFYEYANADGPMDE